QALPTTTYRRPSLRGGEADEAIQGPPVTPGLLRCARNDGSRFLDESEFMGFGISPLGAGAASCNFLCSRPGAACTSRGNLRSDIWWCRSSPRPCNRLCIAV